MVVDTTEGRAEKENNQSVIYLREAYSLASKYSHDPRTQNGAILVKNRQVIGQGVNALPLGVKNLPERLERPAKYMWLEHAERNAIFQAAKWGYEIFGSTLYVPWYACCDCAKAIIQAGVYKVVGHKQMYDQYGSGPWDESIEIGNKMFEEAGVITEYYDGEIGSGLKIKINGVEWCP